MDPPPAPALQGLPDTPVIELLDAPSLRSVRGARVPLERKDAALLALLALDGPRPRAEAAALLWPDADAAHARNSLRQRLFRLQRAAGADIVDANGPLRLRPGVSHDLDTAAQRLARDADAPAGELLGTHDYADCPGLAEWVEHARQRWRRQRADALALLASQHEAQEQLALALRYAERLAADEPLLEHAHRRLMRLHYLRGDRGAALAAFERCRALLALRLDAAPDAETLALMHTIAAGEPGMQALSHRPAPVTLRRPPRVVGRDVERARLAQALAARSVLVLTGEPGIGKTHLLEDVSAGSADLLCTAALAGEAGVPYALLARIAREGHGRFHAPLEGWVAAELARLVPELGVPAPPARLDALRLRQAAAKALDAWSAAGLAGVVVDDLHHADAASLEAVLALAEPRGPPGIAWVLGVRAAELPAELSAWLDADDGARVQRLPLAVLDLAGVQALLDSLALPDVDPAAWAPALARHTGGNPLFVLETLRALLAAGETLTVPPQRLPLPGALHTLIERRLGRLPDAALRLARVAALAGSDFDADVAAQVLDLHPLDIVEPWRALEDAQMFRQGRFAHDVFAEVVARTLPQAIAQALHGRIAACLQALGRAPGRVAPHWARAAAWSRAGEAYVNAAREAQRASRRADEVALWEQAAACYDAAGESGLAFDARADSIESLMLVRGVHPAHELVERQAQDEQTESQRLRRLTALASVCLMSADAPGGETAARAAFETATRLQALWPRFAAARLLGVALAQTGRPAEARAVIEPFREPVMADGTDEQRNGFWSDYAYVLRAGLHMHETAGALREAMRYAQARADHAELATLTSNLATVEGNFGHVEIALDLAKRSRALRDPLGDVGGPASGAIDMYVGVYGAGVGRYDEALADLDRAIDCFGRDGQALWRVVASNHKVSVLLQLGQAARARQALLPPPEMAGVKLRSAMLAARLDRALGRRDDGALSRAVDALGGDADPYVRLLAQLDVAGAMPAGAAVEACRRVEEEAEALQATAVALRAGLLRLMHLSRVGVTDRSLADRLVDVLVSSQPADLYPPQAWWWLHQHYLALDDVGAAGDMLRRGFGWLATRALPNVPAAFRPGFLQRNPVNVDLAAAAGRLLGLHVPSLLTGFGVGK
jgi:DNA-binding SARP family transcriptional activator